MKTARHCLARCSILLIFAAIVAAMTGCAEKPKKEKVIDIKAPGVSVEVEREVDSGNVTIDARSKSNE